MVKCNFCGVEFEQTPYQIRKRSYKCKACRNLHEKAYYQKRAEEGRPRQREDRAKNRERARLYRASKPNYKEYMREYDRNRWKNLKVVRHAEKEYARKLVRSLFRRRVARPKACTLCGVDTKPHAHHKDYKKPFAIVWLCRACHAKVHHKDCEENIVMHLIEYDYSSLYRGKTALEAKP